MIKNLVDRKDEIVAKIAIVLTACGIETQLMLIISNLDAGALQ